MKHNVEKRLEALEEKEKPPVISTLVDLISWYADHEDDEEAIEVELSPEMQALVDDLLERIEEDDHP